MKVLELFAGTRSISKAFERAGHECFTIEFDTTHPNISWYAPVERVLPEDILERFGHPNVIWASPPCTTYSVASISHHRYEDPLTHNLEPKTREARHADELVSYTLDLIKALNPEAWFIENLRGALRKTRFMADLPRYTVTYCQYGDTRQKPTDIWTNHPDPQFRPPCKSGDPCHERAPRGSRTGTQGIKGAKMRSVIPNDLCEHIVEICEKVI